MDPKTVASELDGIRRHDLFRLARLIDELAQVASAVEQGNLSEAKRRCPEVAYAQTLARRIDNDLDTMADELRRMG